MMNSVSFHDSRNSSNSSSTDDTKFLISDLLVPLKKEEKTEPEPSISSFCNWCFLQCCKKYFIKGL